MKINASDQHNNVVTRKILQKHTAIGIPEISVGKTVNGTYFYKEVHPKPFKYVYTALMKSDGTQIIAQDLGNSFSMIKSKNGVIFSNLQAERHLTPKNKKIITTWSDNTLNGKKQGIPDCIMKVFKTLTTNEKKSSPTKSIIQFFKRKFCHSGIHI